MTEKHEKEAVFWREVFLRRMSIGHHPDHAADIADIAVKYLRGLEERLTDLSDTIV